MEKIMRRAWIVVANRTEAKIFEKRGWSKNVKLVQSFEHPEGRLRDQELVSDRPGRSMDSTSVGGHGTESEHSPHDRVAETFAKSIATALEQHRNQHHFDDVVLVAEPKFLGMLRASVSHRSHVHVQSTVEGNWLTLAESELMRRIGELPPTSA